MLFGTLEAGGTKMVLSVGNENNELLEQISIPTEAPEKTIPAMIDWFRGKGIVSLGIGTFGPVDLKEESDTYGWITKTPKAGWSNKPLLPPMRDELGVPAMIDTDVNAAALAEWKLGAARGLNSCVYVTVGTGIGAGLVIEGKLVHGLVHPELGHMLLRQESADPKPAGFCPYHNGCLEGLAAGPAIEKRWGKKGYELPEDHEAWDLEASYLAQMCVNMICAFSPEKIILGGGVMQQKHLFPWGQKAERQEPCCLHRWPGRKPKRTPKTIQINTKKIQNRIKEQHFKKCLFFLHFCLLTAFQN